PTDPDRGNTRAPRPTARPRYPVKRLPPSTGKPFQDRGNPFRTIVPATARTARETGESVPPTTRPSRAATAVYQSIAEGLLNHPTLTVRRLVVHIENEMFRHLVRMPARQSPRQL